MNYDGELKLLTETFRKCRIPVTLVQSDQPLTSFLDSSLHLLFEKSLIFSTQQFLARIKPFTVYRLSGAFGFCFLFLQLPDTPKQTALFIGPYLPDSFSQQQLYEIGEIYHIPPHRFPLLERYYSSLPYLPDTSHLFPMLDAFCDRIWEGATSAVVDIDQDFWPKTVLPPATLSDQDHDVLLDMQLMERRYAAENELLQAVTKGQVQKGATLMAEFTSMPFEKRLDDPLRNLKNYSIIMNTLLRKAAEAGGVHPVDLNHISSEFAQKIEQVPTVTAVQILMRDMFRSYCLLVRNRSMKGYSQPVQKALLTIHADLAADLSLASLSKVQNINASYLSALFKKETGQTLTEYITAQRMQMAIHLLETTRLQIQTVALHCGMVDVHYFSKLFKKYTGKTPKEYRLSRSSLKNETKPTR